MAPWHSSLCGLAEAELFFFSSFLLFAYIVLVIPAFSMFLVQYMRSVVNSVMPEIYSTVLVSQFGGKPWIVMVLRWCLK